MKLVLRAVPWIVTSCLALACESEKPAPPADASGTKSEAEAKAGADAKAGVDAKTGSDAKAGSDAKSGADAKVGSDAKAGADPKLTPTPTPTPKPAIIPPKPVPPRTVVFYRKALKDRLKLWVLPEATAADPTAARELDVLAEDEGGDVFHGTTGPVLSGDGQWLAYTDQGRLQLARVDGSENHRITKHKSNRVMLLISGFSPDSSRLMFYQGEVQTEEGAALPKDVTQGSYELTVADRTLSPMIPLESFESYTDDGRHVLRVRQLVPTRDMALSLYDLDTGTEEQLQKTSEMFGYTQLVLHGERIAYLRTPSQGRSRIAVDDLRGGARIDVGPEANFAQLQWPRFSLDGRHVSYSDDGTIMLYALEDGSPRELTKCAVRHCSHSWDGATTAIVLDGTDLERVSLEGTVTTLASDVEGFVIAGEPG
jgi:hypothetical protein